jgi:uncharacterized protein
LVEELVRWAHQVSSPVAEVEVRRAARRTGQPLRRAEDVVAQLGFVPLDQEVRLVAGGVGSPSLRSLDAIHLASALALGDDLGAFCCYDARLLADAEAAGLNVLSPGLH